MRSTKWKRSFLTAVILICFLLAGSAAGQPRVTAEVLNPGESGGPYVQEAIRTLEASPGASPAVYGTACVLRLSRPLAAEETAVVLPYLRCAVRDVGTAGSSDWNFEGGCLVLLRRGSRQVLLKEIELEDACLTVEADPNTKLFKGSEAASTVQMPAPKRIVSTDGDGLFSCPFLLSAATWESPTCPNGDTSAALRWEGTCLIRRPWRPNLAVRFSLAHSVPYRNNII